MKNKLLFSLIFTGIVISSQQIFAQSCSTDSVQLKSQVQMLFSVPIGIVADRMNRPYCYVAGKEGGLSILNMTNIQSPQLLLNLPTSIFDSLDIMYLVQEGHYLYIALGNFFGTNPQKPGLAILDIDTPSSPHLLDLWKWSSVTKGASSVLIDGNYAYLSAMTQGIFVLNINNKSNIQFESNFIPDPNWPVVNPNAIQAPNARGMAYRNDTLYLCYDAGGLRVIDVSIKTNPVQLAQYLNPGSTSKQEAFNHIILDGNLAYISEDYCGMEVVDVSNISNLTQIGWWNPWNCELPGTQWNGCPGHTNQMVYNQALKIIFLSAGDSELRIVDVSNPALPDSCNGWGPTGNSKASWGTDVLGPYIYITYINSFIPYFSNWSGFKVLIWPQISGVMENQNKKFNFEIFPNPAQNFITINFSDKVEKKGEITIYSVLGNCLKKEQITDDEKISISNFDHGVYFISVNNANGLMIQKFFKN